MSRWLIVGALGAVLCVSSNMASAGDWAYGVGETANAAIRDANANVKRASKCSCYEPAQTHADKCKQLNNGLWQCQAYIHHHAGSCRNRKSLPSC